MPRYDEVEQQGYISNPYATDGAEVVEIHAGPIPIRVF